jgi:glycosyltransferase involved in cell wall biosynthesis
MRYLAPPPHDAIHPRELPTISVVIAAFNAADTIGESVHSALDQVRPAHEVIVVDDGSTDDLDQALAPFADRIVLIHQENRGAASARNTAVEAATGEYVAFLDADDRFDRRRLDVLSQLMACRPDLDIVATDAVISVEGVPQWRFSESTPFHERDQRRAIFETCFVTGWPAVRVSRLRAIGGFDEKLRIAFDWDCYIRLILDGAAAGFVPEPYYEYRQVENALTTDRVRALQERAIVLRKVLDNPGLMEDERGEAVGSLRRKATRAALAELEAALTNSNRMHRRRFLRLAGSRYVSRRARVLLTTGAVAPRLARRLVPHDAGPLRRRITDRHPSLR